MLSFYGSELDWGVQRFFCYGIFFPFYVVLGIFLGLCGLINFFILISFDFGSEKKCFLALVMWVCVGVCVLVLSKFKIGPADW